MPIKTIKSGGSIRTALAIFLNAMIMSPRGRRKIVIRQIGSRFVSDGKMRRRKKFVICLKKKKQIGA